MPTIDARLERWIRRELAAETLRAPSLIVSVWGDALAPRGSEFWLSTLFRLLAPFGVNERAVRTGMFRLARGGWVEARQVGRRSRYRLTAAGTEAFERAFHRVYDAPFVPWDGDWEGVLVDAERAGPALRRRLRDQLAWAGFGRFGAGVFLRPARLDAAAEGIAAALRVTEAVSVFTARDPVASSLPGLAARGHAVWSLGALAGEYRRFIARFGGVVAGLRNPAPEQAFVVRMLSIHAYRRVRLRDPQLPREVLDRGWPGATAYELAGHLYRATRTPSDRLLNEVFAAEREVPRRRARSPDRFARPRR